METKSLTYGSIVKEQRRLLGLTVAALAKKAGTHKGYISGIENGKVSPPAAGLTTKLCRILGLRRDDMQIRGWAEKAPRCVRRTIQFRLGFRETE